MPTVARVLSTLAALGFAACLPTAAQDAAARAELRGEVDWTTIRAEGGQRVLLSVPKAFATDSCRRRLYGTPEGVAGRFSTLFEEERRVRSYETALRRMVQRAPGDSALPRVLERLRSAGAEAESILAFMELVQGGAGGLDSPYTGGAAGDAREHLARVGEALGAAREHAAVARLCDAVAREGALAAGDLLVGAFLQNALATDEAARRLAALESIMTGADAPLQCSDGAWKKALARAGGNLERSRSGLGALLVSLSDREEELVDASVSLGAKLASALSKASAGGGGAAGPWIWSLQATYGTLSEVSEQWHEAQDAVSMATLVELVAGAGPRRLSPDERAGLLAQGHLVYHQTLEQVYSATGGALRDFLLPGHTYRDLREFHAAQRKRYEARLARGGSSLSAVGSPQTAEVEDRVTFTNSVGMRMVRVPSGSFAMGSPRNEPGRDGDEDPLHRVTLSGDFYLGETEVTQGQWKAVMEGNPSDRKGDDLPVESVSWDDAVAFCKALSAVEPGMRYRLPTEAEWEYACRAGTTTRFSSGDSEESLRDVAWFGDNSGRHSHEVKTKAPNAWGLLDMHGNVYEWCADWFGGYPSSGVTDPAGPSSGSFRVLRGGSWYDDARYCRSARRDRDWPGFRDPGLGFRVLAVRAPEGRPEAGR